MTNAKTLMNQKGKNPLGKEINQQKEYVNLCEEN